MAKNDTIIQIAEAAGVSPTTVSMVLNGKADRYRISPATQERVQAVIEQAAFTPNQHARSLRTNKTMTLGLVVADLSTHYFSHIAKVIEEQARINGYQLLIVDADNNPDNEALLIDQLELRGVDGIIVASTQADWSESCTCPVVFLDRGVVRPTLDQASEKMGVAVVGEHSIVATNNEQATYDLISALIERQVIDQNCKYIGGDIQISTATQRWAGFARALSEHGLDPQQVERLDGSYSHAWGKAAMQQLAAVGFRQGAIFCGAQIILEGLLAYWQEQADVPAAIKLCTFDDHPFFNYLQIPVSSIEQDIVQLAGTAIAILLQHIENPAMPAAQRIIPARLHLRH